MTTNASNEQKGKLEQNTIARNEKGSNSSSDENDKEVANIFGNSGGNKNKQSTSSDDDDDDDKVVMAPITIAPDGGWGWVVVASSFWNLFNVLGTGFSFGAMKEYIMAEMNKDVASIALINSLALGLMCLFGPIASALINRFGFRIVAMAGSVISAFATFVSSFAVNYTMLLVFYGVILGTGFAFTNSSSILVVGFYFQKKRALALALTICGTSVGVTVWSPAVNYLNKIGWRPTILLQSCMLGTMFFSSMAFKPLLSITVKVNPQTSNKTKVSTRRASVLVDPNVNKDFRLAKEFVDAADTKSIHTDESEQLEREKAKNSSNISRVSKISRASVATLIPNRSDLLSLIDLEMNAPSNVEIIIHNEEEDVKQGCCAKFFTWTPHVKEARPMYRDDAFYQESIRKLDEHLTGRKGSMSALKYKLAVSRVTTLKDMREKRGLCSTAVIRVLASMADPRLLKLKSFDIMLVSVLMTYSGIIIPFTYLASRGKYFEIPESHYSWFVSVFSLSGMFGRLIVSLMTSKIPAVYCCQIFGVIAGASCIISNYMESAYLQYCFCIIYGFAMSGVVICRNLIIVDLYGLKLLTNGAGLVAFAMGAAYFLSPPIAGLIMQKFGVLVSFVFGGLSLIFGALLLVLVPIYRKRETTAAAD